MMDIKRGQQEVKEEEERKRRRKVKIGRKENPEDTRRARLERRLGKKEMGPGFVQHQVSRAGVQINGLPKNPRSGQTACFNH